MKIRSIHFHQAGPLGQTVPYICEFKNDWQGGLHESILLSGVNGSGKSTVLRGAAHLWALAGSFLSAPDRAQSNNAARRWLARWGGVAMILDDAPVVGAMGLAYGERAFIQDLRGAHPHVNWLGGARRPDPGRNRPQRGREIISPPREPWVDELSEFYKQLILKDGRIMPNMIHLDGEERRWVSPTKGVGEVVADDTQMSWLAGYRPSEDWKGQLEASLIALKTLNEEQYFTVLGDLNQFLKPKLIDPQPAAHTLRLRVLPPNGDPRGGYSLDDLSAGEHQVLIQLYLVSRWLNKGGIVMIDEPDLHLHPSLLNSFLSRLETLVSERKGQLILTSHNPALWRRYENKGLRIQMGGEQ